LVERFGEILDLISSLDQGVNSTLKLYSMDDNSTSLKEQQFSYDIRRSILLAKYIHHWGQPSKRTVSIKEGMDGRVEVYEFPPQQNGVYRIVTIGVSCQTQELGATANWELLFCLPEDLGGTNSESAVHYLLDIMAYSLRADVGMKVGALIPESSLAPGSWSTKAILIDEARGEDEEMSSINIVQQTVDLLWMVPLTRNEYSLIKNKGIEEFDRIEAASDVSLLDVNRDGIV